MGGSEHSDNADLPIVASEYCIDPLVAPQCALADPVNPLDSFRKWDATLEQARAASTPTFTAFRGFEWTSDRFGHINVYFSQHDTNAKADGGYATMDTFYSWLTRAPSLGGGADGLAVFNHPGAQVARRPRPRLQLERLRLRAGRGRPHGRHRGLQRHDESTPGSCVRRSALDKGWHVGAVGAEDLGHQRTDDWGGPGWAKTVILANGRSEAAIKAAMLARRFYAVRTPGHAPRPSRSTARPMGSRIAPHRGPGRCTVQASVNDPTAKLELVTSVGEVVATGTGSLSADAGAPTPAERYYFVRALDAAGKPIAYSSPVWVAARPRPGARRRRVAGGRPARPHVLLARRVLPAERRQHRAGRVLHARHERRARASSRRARAASTTSRSPTTTTCAPSADPDFGTYGVIGIPAYENSLRGHAQMLRDYARATTTATARRAAVNAMADALRADGGVFQINHPAGDIEQPFDNCSDTGVLDWTYGYDVRPDTIEVWNVTNSIQFAEAYWECWLDRGDARRRDRRQRLALALDRRRAGRRQPDDLGVRRATARRAGDRRGDPRRAAPRSRACRRRRAARRCCSRPTATATAPSSRAWATPCRPAAGCAWSLTARAWCGCAPTARPCSSRRSRPARWSSSTRRPRAAGCGRRCCFRRPRPPSRRRAASPTACRSAPARTTSWSRASPRRSTSAAWPPVARRSLLPLLPVKVTRAPIDDRTVAKLQGMCRNIRTLHNFDPSATDEEIRASALQYVRKVSGTTKPSKATRRPSTVPSTASRT